jgi:hypothetical protein
MKSEKWRGGEQAGGGFPLLSLALPAQTPLRNGPRRSWHRSAVGRTRFRTMGALNEEVPVILPEKPFNVLEKRIRIKKEKNCLKQILIG